MANGVAWRDNYDEMARKTVIRRIAKRLPSSADFEQVIQSDNEVVGFVQQPPIDITPERASPETAKAPSRLGAATPATAASARPVGTAAHHAHLAVVTTHAVVRAIVSPVAPKSLVQATSSPTMLVAMQHPSALAPKC